MFVRSRNWTLGGGHSPATICAYVGLMLMVVCFFGGLRPASGASKKRNGIFSDRGRVSRQQQRRQRGHFIREPRRRQRRSEASGESAKRSCRRSSHFTCRHVSALAAEIESLRREISSLQRQINANPNVERFVFWRPSRPSHKLRFVDRRRTRFRASCRVTSSRESEFSSPAAPVLSARILSIV